MDIYLLSIGYGDGNNRRPLGYFTDYNLATEEATRRSLQNECGEYFIQKLKCLDNTLDPSVKLFEVWEYHININTKRPRIVPLGSICDSPIGKKTRTVLKPIEYQGKVTCLTEEKGGDIIDRIYAVSIISEQDCKEMLAREYIKYLQGKGLEPIEEVLELIRE